MHIKDYNDAMTFFRTYDSVASKGKWKEFVDEMEFDSIAHEPRTMANGGMIIPPEKPKLPQIKLFGDRLRTYVKAGAIEKDYAAQLLQEKMEELGVSEEELRTITGRRGEADGGRIGLEGGKDVMPVRMTVEELHDFLGLEKSKGKTPFNKIYRNLDVDAYLDLNPSKVTQKAGGGSQWMFDKPSKAQIEEIMKIHVGSGGAQSGTIRKATANAVRKLYKDTTFINFLEKYKPGDKIPKQVIRKIFSADGAYSPHIASTLGRILEGQLELEGIKINKKLGAKIQQGMEYSTKGGGMRGAWHTAAYDYARNQLNSLDPSKSFRSYQNDVTRLLKELNLPNMSVDEIRSIRSGGTTSSWSVFSQILTEKQNKFKGYKFDSETATKQIKLREEMKIAQETGDYTKVNKIITEQDKFVESFKNQHPEFKKTNLTRFDLRPPEQVLGAKVYNELPLGIKNALDADFAKNKYSINVGKEALTQRQLIKKLEVIKILDKSKIKKIKILDESKIKKIFGKSPEVLKEIEKVKKTGNIKILIRILKSLITRKPYLSQASDDLLNTLSEGDIPSVAVAEVEEDLSMPTETFLAQSGGRAGFKDGSGDIKAGEKGNVEKIKKILSKKGIDIKSGKAELISKKLLTDFGKMGLKGGKLLRWLQFEYDVLFETLVYQYHRQYEGHEPELAREALWLPKIIAKHAPDLWEKVGFEPFKTGVWEGPEKILEERLMGENKLVKNYIDNQKRMEELGSKFQSLEFQKRGSSRVQLNPEQVESFENQQAALSDEYDQLEQLNKPDSLSGYHSAYTTALEKQDTEYGVKATEAHKKRLGVKDYPWDIENPNEMLNYNRYEENKLKRAQERFEKELADKRQREMEEKFPTLTKSEVDKKLEASGYVIDPNIAKYKKDLQFLTKEDIFTKHQPAFPPGVEAKPVSTHDMIRGILRDKDKLKYYADNFRMEKADGGLTRTVAPDSGGILSLKKKW